MIREKFLNLRCLHYDNPGLFYDPDYILNDIERPLGIYSVGSLFDLTKYVLENFYKDTDEILSKEKEDARYREKLADIYVQKYTEDIILHLDQIPYTSETASNWLVWLEGKYQKKNWIEVPYLTPGILKVISQSEFFLSEGWDLSMIEKIVIRPASDRPQVLKGPFEKHMSSDGTSTYTFYLLSDQSAWQMSHFLKEAQRMADGESSVNLMSYVFTEAQRGQKEKVTKEEVIASSGEHLDFLTSSIEGEVMPHTMSESLAMLYSLKSSYEEKGRAIEMLDGKGREDQVRQALIRMLGDPDYNIRIKVVSALNEVSFMEDVEEALIPMALNEVNDDIREEAQYALATGIVRTRAKVVDALLILLTRDDVSIARKKEIISNLEQAVPNMEDMHRRAKVEAAISAFGG